MAKAKPKVAKIARFTLDDDGKTADLELASLTLGERIEIEEFAERPWVEIAGTNWIFSEKVQAFLAFIALRRKKPGTTLGEVLEAKKLSVEYDPKGAAASKETPGKSGSRS